MSKQRHVSLGEVQQVLLKLLNELIDICVANDITYWLDGGTLLGARRDGQFIAWDDDLDVCIPFNDYIRLRPLLENVCANSTHHVLYSQHRNIAYWSDSFGTTRILKHGLVPVEIDIIYAKSIAPTDEEALTRDDILVDQAYRYIFGRSKVRPNKQSVNHPLTLSAKANFMADFCLRYLPEIGSICPGYLINYAFNDRLVIKHRPWYTYEQIFPLSTITFEGRVFNAPNRTDEYLKILYGEHFLSLPPVSSRCPSAEVYLERDISHVEAQHWLSYYSKAEQSSFRARLASSPALRRLRKVIPIGNVLFKAIINRRSSFAFRYLFYLIRN